MKNKLYSVAFLVIAILILFSACSSNTGTDEVLFYIGSVPDGGTFTLNRNSNVKELQLYTDETGIPEPAQKEIVIKINDKEITFNYSKPVPGYYGNYSYLFIAESGESIKVDPSGTVIRYDCANTIQAEGPKTTMTEQEIIDIATQYAIELYGESFTDYYEMIISPDLSDHIMRVKFQMKSLTSGYDYGSQCAIFVDSDGKLIWVISSNNMYKLIDSVVPSYLTESYIEDKCKSLVEEKDTVIEISPERKLFVILNDTICLAVNISIKGNDQSVSLFFPIN